MDLSEKRYRISVANFIRDKLAGYRGGSAIAGEMIQNADDARATRIEFVFSDTGLTVRNNSYFSEEDFDNILEIARGGKRDEEGKTGTWGTGFISVFHLTDRPELRSNGWHVIFDINNDVPPVKCDIGQSTEFWLPWRHSQTPTSNKIDAGVWTTEAIDTLRADIVNDAYQLILFLRHVTEIAVSQIDVTGHAQRLCTVTRKLDKQQLLPPPANCMREQWTLTREVQGQSPTADTWVYYRREIDIPVNVQNTTVTIKDRAVAVAYPLAEHDWLKAHVHSVLYNFLPTPIETGYPFQLNGAFFPDNNRREIWLNSMAHAAWRNWNQHVLTRLAELVIDCLIDVRDLVATPRRFCELLPVTPSSIGYLRVIYDRFVDRANQLEIAYTSLNTWLQPKQVFLGQPGSKLPTLAQAYVPVLATGLTQDYRTFLRDHCSMPALTWRPVFDLLGRHTGESHPLLAERDNLEALCQELPRVLTNDDIAILNKVAFVPGEDGRLCRPSELWYVADDFRPLVGTFERLFVEAAFQKQFASLLKEICGEFNIDAALAILAEVIGPATGIGVHELEPIIADDAHWFNFLSYLGEHRRAINLTLLKAIPIARAADRRYYRPQDGIYFHANRRESDWLAQFGLRFVHPDQAQRSSAIAQLYSHSGVRELRPRDVIQRLREQPDALPKDVDALLELYNYLHQYRSQLEESDNLSLRQLPLVMTQGERLVACAGQTLHLPSEQAIAGSIDAILDKLELDNIVSSRLADDGRKFLKDVLGLKHLDPQQLIDDVILRNYAADCFNDEDRLSLLRYVSRYLSDYGSTDAKVRGLWEKLTAAAVILCEDGAYRRAAEITLRSPVSDEVLGTYPAPHEQYGFTITGETKSNWQWFFERLGINLLPTPQAVMQTVAKIVNGGTPADGERLGRIRTIYGWLNRQDPIDPAYRPLAQIAWLPASDDQDCWYKPSELQRASNNSLVGEQAKLLAFAEPITPLRDLLGIPLWPTVDIVVKHLLASAAANRPIKGVVYHRLADGLSMEQREVLKRTPSIYDNKRNCYWLPSHVFFSDQSAFFGARRGYLRQSGEDAVDRLWMSLGVREGPSERDFIDVAHEISTEEYADNQLSEADVELLYAIYSQLGKPLALEEENSTLPQRLAGVKIPDDQLRLHAPRRVVIPEPPNLLAQFDKALLPCVDLKRMTTEIRLLWQRLGVAVLRDIVRQVPHNTGETWRDDQFTRKLQQLSHAFERIALTVNRAPTTRYRSPEAVLSQITVKRCEALRAFYRLEGADGWRVDGHISDAKAVYDQPSNTLFLQNVSISEMRLALALTLDDLLFPEAKKVEAIEQLLDMDITEVERYLDARDYMSAQRASEPTERRVRRAAMADFSDEIDRELQFEEERRPPVRPTPPPVPAQQPQLDLPPEDANANAVPERPASPRAIPAAPPTPTPAAAAEPYDTPAPATIDNAIPAFKGRVQIETPRRPNDYRALKRKYGLEFDPEPADDVYDAEAVPVSGDAWPAGDAPQRHVTEARFVLRYSARENGYLPLTARAREMLSDRPARLACTTNYPEWRFDLYADYQKGVLYNQEELTAFFDEYNIPAGGIIYLERTSESNVRLFWKSLPTTVKKLRLLYLDETGQLHEKEVDAADYPCEVHEYVLRSDKRLEDIDALFEQARDKDGIFQIMCDVFGEANRVLDFDAIFEGVTAQRLVSHVSIEYQLNERDCFVALGDGRWRFEPARGGDRRKPAARTAATTTPAAQRPSSVQQPVTPALPVAQPYSDNVAERLQGALSRWQTATASPESRLRRLIDDVKALLRYLETALAELTREATKTDEQLTQRWQQLAEGADPVRDAAFLSYLDKRGELTTTLEQVSSLLLASPADTRTQVYTPLLLRWAEEKVAAEARQAATAIYELLHRVGYNVQPQLAELATWQDVDESIELVRMADSFTERWDLWSAAWESHRNNARVRHLMAEDLAAAAAALDKDMDTLIGAKSTAELGDRVCGWLHAIMPTADAWGSMAEAERVWAIGRTAFEALMKYGDISGLTDALQIAALMPPSPHRLFATDLLLQAALGIAGNLFKNAHSDEGAYLLAYMLFVTGQDKQRKPNPERLLKAYEQFATYCEQLSLHPIAYRALHAAKKQTNLNSRKLEIGRQQDRLRKQCGEIDIRRPVDEGFPKAMPLSERLQPLINPALREAWIAAA